MEGPVFDADTMLELLAVDKAVVEEELELVSLDDMRLADFDNVEELSELERFVDIEETVALDVLGQADDTAELIPTQT